MKTMWTTMALAVCTSIGLARGFDFVPPHGICALGRIARVEEAAPNRWSIEITDVRVLLQNSELRDASPSEAAATSPTALTLDLTTGLGGILVSPTPEWIGRTVLFSGSKGNGVFTVPNLPLPLSPNGASFAVFALEQEAAIASIEQAASILNMTNSVVRLQHLVELVESPTEPVFLKRFSIQQVARIVGEGPELNPDVRGKLLGWRDGRQLSPELRLCVDETLVNHSPRRYQWSKERLSFLRDLLETPNLSPENANVVNRRIIAARALESSGVPKNE